MGAGRDIQGMEALTNKGAHVCLDNDKGSLSLSGLLEGTMIFLYDSSGVLKGKYQYVSPSTTFPIPLQGVYVLVMSHPNCQPEVRRIMYNNNMNYNS